MHLWDKHLIGQIYWTRQSFINTEIVTIEDPPKKDSPPLPFDTQFITEAAAIFYTLLIAS